MRAAASHRPELAEIEDKENKEQGHLAAWSGDWNIWSLLRI